MFGVITPSNFGYVLQIAPLISHAVDLGLAWQLTLPGNYPFFCPESQQIVIKLIDGIVLCIHFFQEEDKKKKLTKKCTLNGVVVSIDSERRLSRNMKLSL